MASDRPTPADDEPTILDSLARCTPVTFWSDSPASGLNGRWWCVVCGQIAPPGAEKRDEAWHPSSCAWVRARGRAGVSPQPEWEVFTASDGEQALRMKDRSPQPEITRQRVRDVIAAKNIGIDPEGDRWVIHHADHFGDLVSLLDVDKLADAVWALLAGGATPAGPEGAQDCSHLVGDVWPCAGVEGHAPPHVARLWPKPPVGATPAGDDQSKGQP